MNEEDRFTMAAQEAMEASPVSRRELARRADLSHTLLNDIANGGQRATPSVVESLGQAMQGLSQECYMAAVALRDAFGEAKRELKRCGSTETVSGEPCRRFRSCKRCGRCSAHCQHQERAAGTCEECGGPLHPDRPGARWCSPECATKQGGEGE